uniref:Isopenicillin N synthase-like Fe(2+) 2OG dioxygenase domain-containing protein n=2 Tax=Oryza brachyantha TaxID=4533 RepID=J3L5C3_ORYBR
MKRELGRWFRRSDRVAGEEFYWPWPASSDADRVLDAALAGSTYPVFREKMEIVASKMEGLAQCVMTVLSDNAKNPKDSALPTEAASILCLTLYNCNKLKTLWNEFGSTDPPNSYALSIHISGRDQEICLRNQCGSTFFSLPAGSMLVTIGKQIQEWSNGEFKNAVGEILFELTDEPNPFISLELLYSPGHLHFPDVGRHERRIDPPKTVYFRDQILVALVLLVFFYLFWR